MNSSNCSLQHKPQLAWEFPCSICCPQLAPGAPASSVDHHGASTDSQLHRQCHGSTAVLAHLPWKCTFVRAPWSGDVELHWNFPVAEHLHVIPSLQHMELEAPDQWYLPRPSPLPYFCSLACICPQGLRLAVHQGRGQRHCEVQLCAGCSATTSVCLLLGKGKQRRRNIDCLRRYQLPGSITRSAKG